MMNKLNNETYSRLVAQAEEARELKLTKLAEDVLSAVGSVPRDEDDGFTYSYEELKSNISRTLWKSAMEIVAYHDGKKADIQKIGMRVEELTEQVLSDIELAIGVSGKIGPNEPALLGQIKK
jgi:hypothetical protein